MSQFTPPINQTQIEDPFEGSVHSFDNALNPGWPTTPSLKLLTKEVDLLERNLTWRASTHKTKMTELAVKAEQKTKMTEIAVTQRITTLPIQYLWIFYATARFSYRSIMMVCFLSLSLMILGITLSIFIRSHYILR